MWIGLDLAKRALLQERVPQALLSLSVLTLRHCIELLLQLLLVLLLDETVNLSGTKGRFYHNIV